MCCLTRTSTTYKGSQEIVDDWADPEPWFAFLKTLHLFAGRAVCERSCGQARRSSIAAVNAEVASLPRPEENAAKVRAAVGLDDASVNNSAMLINLDDWYAIHKE